MFSIAEEVYVHEFSDFQVLRRDVLDHLRKVAGHVSAFGRELQGLAEDVKRRRSGGGGLTAMRRLRASSLSRSALDSSCRPMFLSSGRSNKDAPPLMMLRSRVCSWIVSWMRVPSLAAFSVSAARLTPSMAMMGAGKDRRFGLGKKQNRIRHDYNARRQHLVYGSSGLQRRRKGPGVSLVIPLGHLCKRARSTQAEDHRRATYPFVCKERQRRCPTRRHGRRSLGQSEW